MKRSLHCLLPLVAFLALNNDDAFGQNTRRSSAEPDSNAKPPSFDEAKSRIKKMGDNTYALGPITFNSSTREIQFPAELNMTEGNIEYAIVHENGKTHESLLRTKISAFDLNVALLLCHNEPHLGEIVAALSRPDEDLKKEAAKPMTTRGANRIKIAMTWKDAKGEHTLPLQQCIRCQSTNKLMTSTHWSYTGSQVLNGAFEAQREGSIVAVYLDFIAMINSIEQGNIDDKIWIVETAVVPPEATPVTVIISPDISPAKDSKN